LITTSAALEEGNATPSTYRFVGSIVKEFVGENGVIYPYYDWRAHEDLNLYSAIAWSSNLYMFQISCGFSDEHIKGLGEDVYDSARLLSFYARAFGLGRETGIDIPGESEGIMPTPEWKRESRSDLEIFNPEDQEWYHSDTCFTAVGQGDVLATPIQIATMTAAIANGGRVLVPHVVEAILSPEGEVVRTIPVQYDEVPVSDENLAHVRRGMHESVSYGAGSLAAVAGLDIAGKTGTSEFVLPDGRIDEHAWFTGFYPFTEPEIVVTVYFDLGIGGNDAAPIAARIFDYYAENVAP
jgi:penicillin-binding protein 2